MRSKHKEKAVSKRLSYVLRHAPESIGLSLDLSGWAVVEELLAQLGKHRMSITRKELDYVVANNSKQRFEFSEDGLQIRARQGHSIEVDLDYSPEVPPAILFHGTADRFLPSILEQGLEKRGRHHVHLSTNQKTMLEVGGRHGKAVLLQIDAEKMHADGHQFFVTGNDVWLTEHVPPNFLKQIE